MSAVTHQSFYRLDCCVLLSTTMISVLGFLLWIFYFIEMI